MSSASLREKPTRRLRMRKLALTAIHLDRADGARRGQGPKKGGQNDGGLVAPELSKPTPGHLLNQDYLTSTGETVPRPGVPQASVQRRWTTRWSSRTSGSTRASAAIADASRSATPGAVFSVSPWGRSCASRARRSRRSGPAPMRQASASSTRRAAASFEIARRSPMSRPPPAPSRTCRCAARR